MKIRRIDIGRLIEQKMSELGVSKSELSRRCGIANQNINRVFERPNIDTDKLISISEALDFNFFDYYTSSTTTATVHGDYSIASINSSVTTNDANGVLQAERIKHLEELLAEKERLIRVLMER